MATPERPVRPIDDIEPLGREETDTPEFAPADPLDGRDKLEWQSKYPSEASKEITFEGCYLGAVFLIVPVLLFFVYFANLQQTLGLDVSTYQELRLYTLAWLAGTLGGTLFSIKWLYHSVAKQIWNLDRRLWRVFTPHVSGGLAFCLYALASSGIVHIFDAESFASAKVVVGISFLIGYFSDSALAKLREVAETLFGATARAHH